jgi:cephalosporin-C deacetylase
MRKIQNYFGLILLILLINNISIAQNLNNIIVAPEREDWTYKVGENVKFNISILKFGNPVKDIEITYEIGPERMNPVIKKSLQLKEGRITVDGGTMKQPGFMECVVKTEFDGKKYSDFGSAAFDVEQIKPTTSLPRDFITFWDSARTELSRVPVDSKITLLPDYCSDKVNVYQVNIRNVAGRIYGILCIPKKPGKYPALLQVPGAGVRAYKGDLNNAEKGMITLQIGIHGVPVIFNDEFYTNLAAGPLLNYPTFNLDNKDKYYYKRVYLGCIRAVDYIFSLPEFDGSTIAVYGGSQGGALSIVTAALDKRIKYLGCMFPALCDLTGYLNGRAGGWPHLFKDSFTNTKEKIETSKYYDVVNFARFIKVPGFYTWGFNDNVCPPTSTYSAYNLINAPKELYIYQDRKHNSYPEQNDKLNNWLASKLL